MDDFKGVHTVVLVVRVNSATTKEAERKVLNAFPDRFWPGLAKEVIHVQRGWHRPFVFNPPSKRRLKRLKRLRKAFAA